MLATVLRSNITAEEFEVKGMALAIKLLEDHERRKSAGKMRTKIRFLVSSSFLWRR